jgi:hypothetical protein
MSSAPTPDAHAYPLLIKQLLLMPLAVSPGQEIVYGDRSASTTAPCRRASASWPAC